MGPSKAPRKPPVCSTFLFFLRVCFLSDTFLKCFLNFVSFLFWAPVNGRRPFKMFRQHSDRHCTKPESAVEINFFASAGLALCRNFSSRACLASLDDMLIPRRLNRIMRYYNITEIFILSSERILYNCRRLEKYLFLSESDRVCPA